MKNNLNALLGSDMSDPRVQEAVEDASALMDLIRLLVEERTVREISRRTVAEHLEVTENDVDRFETVGSDPTVSMIMQYARAVGLKIDLVLEGDHDA